MFLYLNSVWPYILNILESEDLFTKEYMHLFKFENIF